MRRTTYQLFQINRNGKTYRVGVDLEGNRRVLRHLEVYVYIGPRVMRDAVHLWRSVKRGGPTWAAIEETLNR